MDRLRAEPFTNTTLSPIGFDLFAVGIAEEESAGATDETIDG